MKLLTKNKNGFTLVEILLVVGFIALAGIGIYTVYTKTNMSNTALNESRNINLIKAGIKNIYGASQGYTGLNNSILNDGRITPDSMRAIPYVAADANINNSFGGVVTVAPVVLGGAGVNNGFRITYPKVPGEICSRLVTMMDKNIEQINVAGTIVKTYGTGNLNVPTLVAQCATDTGNGVTILFDSL